MKKFAVGEPKNAPLKQVRKYLSLQGRKLCVHLSGRSRTRTLVLLHGFCEDSSIWAHLVPQLSAQMRVVCIDLPGFGQSEANYATRAIQLEEEYTEAVFHVLTELKIQHAVVVGHSLGGYVALSLAQKHGAALAGIGLINSHPFADTPERKDTRTKTMKLLQAGGQRQFVKQLITGLFSTDYREQNPDLVAKLIKKAKKNPVQGIITATATMRDRSDYVETMSTTTLPVLMLLGKLDHLIPEAVQHQMIHLPQVGKVLTLPHVAHMAMFEAAAETQTALADFVDLCHQLLPKSTK